MASPSAADILGLSGKTAAVPTGGGVPLPTATPSSAASILGLGPGGVPPTAAAPSGGGHHGFFHRLGSDLVHAGLSSVTGLYDIGKHELQAPKGGWGEIKKEWVDALHGHLHSYQGDPLTTRDIPALVKGTYQPFEHPLRHPGDTLLAAAAIGSLGAGTVLRGAAAARAAEEAGAAARAGADVSRVKTAAGAFLQNPALTTTRRLSVPGDAGRATATGTYSRAGLGMALQKASDAAIVRGAASGSRFAENRLHARVAKWNERAAKVEDSATRAAGHRVLVAGHQLGLDDAQQRALRIVAETVPYDRVLRTAERRTTDAAKALTQAEAKLEDGEERGLSKKTLKTRRNAVNQASLAVKGTEARLQWTQEAKEYLADGPDGRPIIHPDHPELQDAMRLVGEAAGSRETLLKGLKLMDDDSFEVAKTKVARIAAGARYVKPTPGRLGQVKGLAETQKRVAKLEARLNARIAQTKPTGFGAVTRPRTRDEAVARLDDLEHERGKQINEMVKARYGAVDRREVAFRNAENARARRQAAGLTRQGRLAGTAGAKSRLRPNVRDEQAAAVERDIADSIARNPDHPTLQRWAARDAEIDQLRDSLTPSEAEAFNGAPPPQEHPGFGTVDEYRSTHPSVERLGSALSVARDQLERLQGRADALRAPTGIVGAEDVTAGPGAAFIGSPVEQPRRFGIGRTVTSSGTFGHTRPRGSLKEFTGRARIQGLERNDVTRLVAERQYEAAGLTHLARMVDRVRGAGRAVPTHDNDVFVWTDGDTISTARLDPEIKNFLQGIHDENVKRDLSDQQLKGGGLRDALKNAIMEAPKNGRWSLDAEQQERLRVAAQNGQGVFVPRKLLGRDAPAAGLSNVDLSKVPYLAGLNNFQKLGLIYLKINYPIVQGLSNIAFNLIQQGAYAPRNLALAARLGQRVGPDVSAMIDDAVEQGLAGQLAGGERGAGARFSQTASHVATVIADKMPRRAAWLHEAYRQGYRTPEQIRALLTDPNNMGDLVQVTQRAKEAIVDFGDLGPAEKNFVRHLIFVYPWVKGSVKYAGRFLRDHPIQAAALGQLGQQGEAVNLGAFGPRPSYMGNLVPVGGGRAIDLGSLNPFSTPVSVGQSLAALASGNWNAQPPAQMLSPAVQGIVDILRRRDAGNFPLKGSLPVVARNEFLSQMPLAQLAASAPGPQGDVVRSLLGTPRKSKSFPNQQLWLRFLLGGLYPRTYDVGAINKAAAYEASQATR